MRESGSEESTTGQILEQYLPRLLRLAERNLSPKIRAKEGADDVAISVLGSVIRLKQDGKLHIDPEDPEGFWQLLKVITLCKIRKKVRAWNTGKRSVDREQVLSDDGPRLEELAVAAMEPTNDDQTWFEVVLDQLNSQLDDDERLVLEGKLNDERALSIAKKMRGGQGASTRTVSRTWVEIQRKAQSIGEAIE